MRFKVVLQVCLVLAGVAMVGSALILGMRYIREAQVERQILAALPTRDIIARTNELKRIRGSHPEETAAIVCKLLESPDQQVRRSISRDILSLCEGSQVEAALIKNLGSNHDHAVRLGCAIHLMSRHSPAVRDAYIRALHDPYDKVVQIAVGELGYRGGSEAKEALNATLSHPSWRVRLEVCKALITSKYADDRTVSTLEEMRYEPEAAQYDAEIEEMDRDNREMESRGLQAGEMWGNLNRIIGQAKNIAAQNRH